MAKVDPAPLEGPWVPHASAVRRVIRESTDVVSLELDPPPGYACKPGQFNMLYAFGAGEVPISASGDAGKADVLVHTVRRVGMVTAAICRMKKGDVIGVRGPFGRPWPTDRMRGRDLLVVAGGLGLAPLRPLIYHAINHRRDFGEVTLLIGARTPQDLIFADEIEKWARRRDLRVVTTVDHASEGWHGHVGVVPALLPRTPIDASRTSALICGPEIMMKFTVRELQRRGLPDPCIWLTMERSMKCAIGFCGHCQWGASFVCRDGPVYSFDEARRMFWTQEI